MNSVNELQVDINTIDTENLVCPILIAVKTGFDISEAILVSEDIYGYDYYVVSSGDMPCPIEWASTLQAMRTKQ